MDRRAFTGFLIVLAGAFCLGLMPVFARQAYGAGMEPLALHAWRYVLPALLVLPFAPGLWRRRAEAWRHVVFGGVMGACTATYLIGLSALTVAHTVLILYTYPLFVVGFGMALGRRPTMRALGSAVLVLGAAVLIVNPGTAPPGEMWAVWLVFLAPAGIAVFVLGVGNSVDSLGHLQRPAAALLGAGVTAPLVATLFGGLPALPADLDSAIGIAGVGIAGTMLGVGLFAVGGPLTGAARTSIAGSGELIVAMAVGWLAFGEVVSLWMALGAALVLAAILVVLPDKVQAAPEAA